MSRYSVSRKKDPSLREEVISLARAGVPAAEAARATGVNLWTVYWYYRLHGYHGHSATPYFHSNPRGRRVTHDEITRIAELSAEGYSPKEIGKILGRSHTTVYNYLLMMKYQAEEAVWRKEHGYD